MPPRLPLHLAASCAVLVASSLPAHSVAIVEGPEALQALLVRYDRAPAADKDKLAPEIDRVAHQKYATVSRLYWFTDFAAAQEAARAAHKPILSLRMLGRLDEDLSCANSRLFRATLYANTEVSKLLRDSFILYWSSERPVPKVTIDFGGGRKLERTTTGNSAHYVLDADGHVLDVLPGLYAPAVFAKELRESLALAATVRTMSDADRAKRIVAFHTDVLRSTLAPGELLDLGNTPMIVTMATVSKSRMEIPDQEKFAPETVQMAWTDAGIAARATLAERMFQIKPNAPVLDDASRQLVLRLHDAVPGLRSTPDERKTMLHRLERALLADSALNEKELRTQISSELIRRKGVADFATLNEFVYAKVFLTPASDPWLGLLPRTDFTGLPGDGVSLR